MLRHVALLAALSLAAPIVPALADDGPALTAEDIDKLGENIRAEAEAVRHLAKVVRDEVEAGTLSLSSEGTGTWAKGRALWEQIAEHGKAEEYGRAYKDAREARRLMRQSFRELFVGRPSDAVGDALKRYVDAVKPRVAAVKAQMVNYPVTDDAQESFHVAEALWKDAQKSAKKKRWDMAFRQLVDGLAELDKVIYEVYPASR